MVLSEAFTLFDVDKLYTDGRSLKTRKNYRCALNSLLRVIGDIPVELFSYEHVIRWKQEMARLGYQSTYVAGNISHLREVFHYLKDRNQRVIDYRDICRPKVKQKPPTWLTIDELKRFLDAIESVRDKAIFACLFSSAARISELLQLDRNSIIDGEAEILGKGSKPGKLYFDPNALKLLDDYLQTRKDRLKPLFVSGQYRRITVSRIEQLAHKYADAADIDKNVTPHVFRHSRASDFKMNGADISDIQKQLRHSSINTTQIYVHIGNDKIKHDHSLYGTKLPL